MSAAESFAATGPGDVRGRVVGTEPIGRDLRGHEPGHRRGHRHRRPGRSRRRAARHRGRGPRLPRRGRRRPPSTAPRACTRRRRHRGAAATSSPARSRSTRASRWRPRPTARSRSSSTTGAWRPRTPSAWAASCPTRSPRASGSCSCAARWAVVGVITPVELALHDARGADRARAGVRQHRRVDARAVDGGVRRGAGRAASPRPTSRPASSTSSPAPAPSSATRSPPTRAPTPSAFIGSTTTGRLVAQAAAGKVALLEMGGNGPVVVMDDADVDAAVEATLTRLLPVRRPELHGRRAHPRPPRACATSTSRSSRGG